MSVQLPPFSALKAFDATAIHGSITAASNALCVTPAAVSQQIRVLENFLSIELFIRHSQGLKLTEAGRDYLPYVQEAFEKIRQGGQLLERTKSSNVITLSTLPSVATKWLAPRLLSWMKQHPETSVRIEAHHEEVDFSSEPVDFRICFGSKSYDGLIMHELLTDYVTPACNPSLIQGPYPIEDLSIITDKPLIHVDWGQDERPFNPSWQGWLQAAGLPIEHSEEGTRYNLSSMAIEAAALGGGLVLGQNLFIQAELNSGMLVKPFDLNLSLGHPYYLVYPEKALQKHNAQLFIDWLLQEAREVNPL
jgi:LysR family glycine cleavage system transcriptional activator